jgi:hypothetical protein
MNHQPFETWLLSEETLSPQQAKALREHLWACQDCQCLDHSLSGVGQLVQGSGMASPTPGFAARWQVRLAEEHRRRHQRQAWATLAITGSIAAILFVLLGVQALDVLHSPQQALMYVIYRLFSLYIVVQASLQLIPQTLQPLVGLLPLGLWVFALGIASILGVLWIVVYQKIMAFWRVRL